MLYLVRDVVFQYRSGRFEKTAFPIFPRNFLGRGRPMDSFPKDSQAETSAVSAAADGRALAPTGTKLFSEPWKQSALNITFSVASS